MALKNRVWVDELNIRHKARVRELQSKHVAVIDATKRDITQLHNHGNELMEIIYDMAGEVGQQQNVTRNASKSAIVHKPGCRAWREDLHHKLLKIK